MQRTYLLAGALAGLIGFASPASAQDSAAAAAEREEQEANYKRLNGRVEGLEETLQAQKKSMTRLLEENQALREEVDRLKNRNESAATQDSIKRLAEKIEEVDRKRIKDNELVAAKLDKLAAIGKDLNRSVAPKESTPAAPPVPTPKSDKGSSGPDADKVPPEKMFTYKIKDGDTLNRIVRDLRAQGYKVTQKQVMDANPKVNWSRLSIGQTVLIPPSTP